MLDLTHELYETIPLNVLKRIGQENNISISTMNKLDIAKAIVDSLQKERVNQILDEFKYAGRRAVSWFKVPSPNADNLISAQTVRKKLITSCGSDPFSEMLKPKLTEEPRVVFAKIFSKEKVMCQFARLEKCQNI